MKVVKVPFSRGGLGKTEGCEDAPDLILKEMDTIHLNEALMLPKFETVDVDVDQANAEKTFEHVCAAVKNMGQSVFLGGDHSITYALFRAFSEPNAGIIVFDSHPDMMQPFNPPTHENYLRMLIEEGYVKGENVILVGLRNQDAEELRFIRKNQVKTFCMREMGFESLHDICDAVMAAARGFQALYVSIDIDVIDPAFAPGTGHREPGGMSPRELIYFIQRLKNLKNLKAADIVEVNPKLDTDNMTARLAAKILAEFY